MPADKSRSSLLGVGLIAIVFTTLYFLPKFRNTEYSVQPDKAPKSISNFPMEVPLPLVELKSDRSLSSTKKVSLRELLGSDSTLVINFWATWCPPCLEELPSLELLGKQLRNTKGKALPKVIAISVDDDLNDIATLYKTLDFSPSFILLHDKGGTLSTTMGTTKFPETYWVGPDGKVLYKWLGPQDWLSAGVLSVLKSS